MRWFVSCLILMMVFLSLGTAIAEETCAMSADAVLAKLKEGNKCFCEGKTRHPHEDPEWRKNLKSGQHPCAIILSCSDSRVPPELVFDHGLGDLFVIRVAGHVVEPSVAGSIDYGVFHLGTPLVVVMGHENCGAVTAALNYDPEEPQPVLEILQHILPVVMQVQKYPEEERLARAVEENVRQSIRELAYLPVIHAALQRGTLKVVGAVYYLDTGEVRFLDEEPVSARHTDSRGDEAGAKAGH